METVEMKRPTNGVAKLGEADISRMPALEQFTKKINERPSRTEDHNGAAYVPVTFIETDLDEDYAGLWQIENFRWQVVANEIVGSLDLVVFHPIARVWLRRSGSGAVMIRQNKGADISDISAKLKNGLVMDFPKLQTACLKAAAKTLGKKYGRDLNRKFEDEYQTIYTDEAELDVVRIQLEADLEHAATREALTSIWAKYPQYHRNSQMLKIFSSRQAILNARGSK